MMMMMMVVHVDCSESVEETAADNTQTMTIPIQYGTEIVLSRSDSTAKLSDEIKIS